MKQIVFTAILIIASYFATFAQTNESSCPTINISYLDSADLPDCKDCITIKAEDFDKLEKIFQPKSKSKNRKK